jgi:hypothetical protein
MNTAATVPRRMEMGVFMRMPELRHSRAKQPRSGVAKTLDSMPLPWLSIAA